MNRPKQIVVELAEIELAWLERLAEAAGISKADLIRRWIRREDVATFGREKAR